MTGDPVPTTETETTGPRKTALAASQVEHSVASAELEQVGDVTAWGRIDDTGTVLSDHPTIAVDLFMQQ